MGGYVSSVKKEFEFEGQKVVVAIEPIELGDFIQLRKIDPEKDMETAAKLFAGYVKKYVKLIETPKGADGSPISIETICDKAYFLNLMIEIGKAVAATGSVPNPLASAANSPSG